MMVTETYCTYDTVRHLVFSKRGTLNWTWALSMHRCVYLSFIPTTINFLIGKLPRTTVGHATCFSPTWQLWCLVIGHSGTSTITWFSQSPQLLESLKRLLLNPDSRRKGMVNKRMLLELVLMSTCCFAKHKFIFNVFFFFFFRNTTV